MTHHILDPQVLTKYLEIIEDDLEEMAPEYVPVFTSVYQYYGNSLALFTNTIDDLLLQLPILIKDASTNGTFQHRDSASPAGCRDIYRR